MKMQAELARISAQRAQNALCYYKDKEEAMAFTHLHVHTEYSLLDGSSKIKEITKQAAGLGMDSLAITDHGVMYGVIDFYRAAKEAGIKPIIGCEVYVAPGSRFDRESGSGEDRYYHLVLLAENNEGYHNLMKIVSAGFVDGFYYKPRVDYEILEQYHEGVIALSACLAGEVQRYLQREMYEDAKKAALRYVSIFGKENFFLELQDHGIPAQKMVNARLLQMSKETGIELVCTNDVHYTYAEDWEAHDILLCIQTGKKVADEDRMRYEGGQYYLKSEEEMRNLFPYIPQALENTHAIAQRCNVEIVFGEKKLPKYDVPDGMTSWEYLNKLCREGLEERYNPITEAIEQRLEYELTTIKNMGYVDYFLIVWDFINYAKEHDIMVGPGRGSAAGSIVSYCLKITDIDPLKYNLLFERFLNPERVSMPDIDVDFCYERRQEVIDYVVEKYGKDRVAQIVTFGTLQARGVIRDVGRVLDMSYGAVDMIAKQIPTELGMTIDKALQVNPELKRLYEGDAQVRNLIDMSKRLEGLPRHTSMHAAGVVISQKNVDEYVPLSRASDGSITTQFVMTTLEELGLLKMDFLGLRTLTVIQNAARLAQKSTGKIIDMGKIDYDDKQVLASIGTGKTDGVFQLESAGMKSFMKELKPENLEDIIAGISLYRPGPMDFIPKYINGKNNRDSIVYDCPQLKPILEPTYGCIVYQEQVMQIVRDLGGFSLGRSDLLRRAMSKKKLSVMEAERKVFVYGNEEQKVPGCIANGISEEVANRIYDSMIDFAKYAFNKSHAAAYAVVSYQTAYLKYYYPVEFMAALMTSVIDNSAKVAEYIVACRNMGIEILPPDINLGERDFSVYDGKIRFALSAIKSIGRNVIDHIVEERKLHGPFSNLEDFIKRMSDKEVNKRAIENFIKAGAFDTLEGNRKQKVIVYGRILDNVAHNKKNAMSGQMSLFDFAGEEEKKDYEITMPNVEEYDKETMLAFEKEVLGVYVSGHPMEDYEEQWKQVITNSTADFMLDEEGKVKVDDRADTVIGGMVEGITIKATKTNQIMAFLTIEDLYGTVEVIIFPRTYEKYRNLIKEDAKLYIKGIATVEEEANGKVIGNVIYEFDEVPKTVWLRFPTKQQYLDVEEKLFTLLSPYEGQDEVIIYLMAEKQQKRWSANRNIKASREVLAILEETLGQNNVAVVSKKIK
jgi:DNA polymerase-3 subunit alpha